MSKRAREESVVLKGGTPLPEKQIRMWEEGKFCDVAVHVGGRRFVGHSLVLSSSDFISACLQSSMSEASGTIRMEEMEADHFEAVLHFLYKGEAAVPPDSLGSMLQVASRLQIPSLQDAVERALFHKMTLSTLPSAWNLASQIESKSLDAFCTRFAVFLASNLCSSSALTDLSEECLRKLVVSLSSSPGVRFLPTCYPLSPSFTSLSNPFVSEISFDWIPHDVATLRRIESPGVFFGNDVWHIVLFPKGVSGGCETSSLYLRLFKTKGDKKGKKKVVWSATVKETGSTLQMIHTFEEKDMNGSTRFFSLKGSGEGVTLTIRMNVQHQPGPA